MKNNPDIIFFGTPDFARIILEKLIESPYKPSLVVTAPDKPVGRKHILTPPPVKVLAQQHGIEVLQPQKLDKEFAHKLQTTNYKLFIVAAYGKLIPKAILDIPKHGTVNVHPSLLPRLRGPSPIVSAILNSEEKTGVTIMLVDEKMDHGPILAQQEYATALYKITAPELHNELAKLGASLLIDTIPKWLLGEIAPLEQDHDNATFSKMIEREDGHIDWTKSTNEIDRMYRAFTPWPGIFTFVGDRRLKILDLETVIQNAEKQSPGTIVKEDKTFGIWTSSGLVIPLEVQLEGKSPQTAKEFLRTHPEIIASKLS